ncbi:MAG: antitoxin VapB family protein [Candidatus Korarchaeum sp.]|jgi:predicted CopG family antitoxin|nr:antitoxin VapB family protein [Candidatus Korarchaeum sp.]
MTYTTIPVKREVKERLEKFKGEREWSDFLNDLIDEVIRVKREESFRKLRELTLKHLDEIEESHRKFRREFSLDSR